MRNRSGLRRSLRQRLDEIHERLAVLPQRGDRDPLLGAVVVPAHGAELHGRDAGLEERDRVRRAVAADAEHLALHPARDRGAAAGRAGRGGGGGGGGTTGVGEKGRVRVIVTSGIARTWARIAP